jgi:hypothetical protein
MESHKLKIHLQVLQLHKEDLGICIKDLIYI